MADSDDSPAGEIKRLLDELRGPHRSAAWTSFLKRYAGLIHHLAAHYEGDPDRRSECFLHICEKLVDNDFDRLMKYRPEASASFRSWLKIVVANLCIDWRRQQTGRRRPFRCIQDLSSLDQAVFECRFLHRQEPAACLAMLQARYPKLTEPDLAGSVSRINALLTPRQRWLLQRQQAGTCSIEELQGWEPKATAPGPEQTAAEAQQADALNRALRALPVRQQLLIRMRFEQELSYREIARLTRLGDPYRARRHVEAALQQLATLLEIGAAERKSQDRVR